MAIIRGITKGADGNAMPDVTVEVKSEDFQTLHATRSDEHGRFALDVPDGNYPFLTAVRDYATRYLEFWAHNVPAWGCLDLDITIDTLEIYGINAFEVKGAGNALSVYFRPMSLAKFLAGDDNIAPNFDVDDIDVKINGEAVKLLVIDRVREFIGDGGFASGALIQVELPKSGEAWSRVELSLRDREGHVGTAMLFR